MLSERLKLGPVWGLLNHPASAHIIGGQQKVAHSYFLLDLPYQLFRRPGEQLRNHRVATPRIVLGVGQ